MHVPIPLSYAKNAGSATQNAGIEWTTPEEGEARGEKGGCAAPERQSPRDATSRSRRARSSSVRPAQRSPTGRAKSRGSRSACRPSDRVPRPSRACLPKTKPAPGRTWPCQAWNHWTPALPLAAGHRPTAPRTRARPPPSGGGRTGPRGARRTGGYVSSLKSIGNYRNRQDDRRRRCVVTAAFRHRSIRRRTPMVLHPARVVPEMEAIAPRTVLMWARIELVRAALTPVHHR